MENRLFVFVFCPTPVGNLCGLYVPFFGGGGRGEIGGGGGICLFVLLLFSERVCVILWTEEKQALRVNLPG